MTTEPSPRQRKSYRARWVFAPPDEPVERGTVEIEAGVVTAIHNRRDPSAADLGNVALIPGLVNAHTHLEFSDLPAPLEPEGRFTDWIRGVVRHRRLRPEGAARQAIERGMRESLAAGVTLLAEIATVDAAEAVPESEPAVCVFRELIGVLPERADEQMAIARRHLIGSRVEPPLRGISPHAPYSVHPDLFDRLVALAVESRAPLMMHLAETLSELELLRHGTGEFAEMLREFGLWRDGLFPRGGRPMDYLRRLADAERALIAHGNYLSTDELDFVADSPQLTVVYCPRTHAYFGHSEHPWRALLKRRESSVALGTDSRASNPDLSVWGELRFLRRQFPDVDPRLLLRLATVNGAEALGWGSVAGTLEVGRPADVAVVSLADDVSSDPWRALLDARSEVAGTMRAGVWRHGPWT